MSETAKDSLIAAETDLMALVSSEQRGFRRILFAGLATLIVLVLMSAALGVYYFEVSKALGQASDRLEREAFLTRIRVDQQTNRVAAQELAIRRAYDEIRLTSADASTVPSAAALEAARGYLQRGHLSLADERLIERAADSERENAALRALLTGVANLIAWERSGEPIQAGAKDLPDHLKAAESAFVKAGADRNLAAPAQNGLAWIRFAEASSARSNYAPVDCEAVFKAVTASAVDGQLALQPLYWRAQCERKLGRTRDALADYAAALQRSSEIVASASDEAELALAMNAYHGVGTVLIAAFDVPDDAQIQAALDLATRACAPVALDGGSPRMRLARACLDQATALRRRLHQTENQVSGTGENVGFSYLRDGDFESTFQNATNVERTGLFAWNELLRALSAKHVNSSAAHAAERDARRNVRFFDIGQFNVCELRILLSPALFDEVRGIIANEHPGQTVGCA